MALVGFTGFEDGLADWWTVTGTGTLAVESATPLSGDHSLKWNGQNLNGGSIVAVASHSVAAGTDMSWLACNFSMSSIQDKGFLSVTYGATNVGFVFVAKPDGAFHVAKGTTNTHEPGNYDSGDVGWTSASGLIVAGATHHLAFEGVVSETVGSVKVWIDGVVVIDETNIDTRNTDASTGRTIYIGSFDNEITYLYDDLIWGDGTGTTFTGAPAPMKVEALRPDGVDGTSDFTGSDANSVDNHLLIDESPISSADYVEASVVGNVDRYTLGNRTDTGTVQAIQVVAVGQNTDGSSDSIDLVVKSNVTTENSAAIGLGAAADKRVSNIWETDPDTAVAWTDGGVNALIAGFEVA